MPNDRKEDPRFITFPCMRMRQPIGDVFVGLMGYQHLCDIAYFDVRRVLQEQRDIERYLGIQRPLNERRVGELKKYVHYYDATFPTSIILAVKEKCASYDEERQEITLKNFPSRDPEEQVLFRQIARVIDGQHRIAGLYDFTGSEFDLSVTIFVGADISDQAQVFSTVNLEHFRIDANRNC